MSSFNLPLSGNVTQSINPWTSVLSAIGNQFSFISVNLGRSSAPEVEQDVLNEVGSYGKQLGRIGDALAVVIAHFDPKPPLSPAEQKTLDALTSMLDEIADIKEQHKRAAVRPRTAR